LFIGLPKEFDVGRYHSWVVNKEDLHEDLEITSIDNEGSIMSLRHKKLNIKSVQFHPESILTPFGKQILQNWINL
jgi:anthranilate synthase component 2